VVELVVVGDRAVELQQELELFLTVAALQADWRRYVVVIGDMDCFSCQRHVEEVEPGGLAADLAVEEGRFHEGFGELALEVS